jgi:hypothetical protein
MLCIHADPIVAAAGHESGMVSTGEHLPGTERQAAAGAQGFLDLVGGLHCEGISCRLAPMECYFPVRTA